MTRACRVRTALAFPARAHCFRPNLCSRSSPQPQGTWPTAPQIMHNICQVTQAPSKGKSQWPVAEAPGGGVAVRAGGRAGWRPAGRAEGLQRGDRAGRLSRMPPAGELANMWLGASRDVRKAPVPSPFRPRQSRKRGGPAKPTHIGL